MYSSYSFVSSTSQNLIFETMGGSSINIDGNDVRNIVLVGRTGNGKSATGNSILGRKAFKSSLSPAGVTKTCELQSTIVNGRQVINVIDTPGLFDFSVAPEFVSKEIGKCVNLSKGGIHAILLVFSVRNRFTNEEEAAIRKLQSFFGEKIADYLIIVFTGGDEFDEDKTFEDYLRQGFPGIFQEILHACKNRVALFDNRTNDKSKQAQQVQQLLSLVNMVIAENGGRPYTDGFLAESKEQIKKSYEEQLQQRLETLESMVRELTKKLEQRVAEERANIEIRELRESLARANREIEELRKESRKESESSSSCAIL